MFQTDSVPTALVVYDFVITLDREMKLFWTRRFTGATVLFFTIRYMPLLYGILGVVKYVPINPSASLILLNSTE